MTTINDEIQGLVGTVTGVDPTENPGEHINGTLTFAGASDIDFSDNMDPGTGGFSATTWFKQGDTGYTESLFKKRLAAAGWQLNTQYTGYVGQIIEDGAVGYWRLSDGGGATAVDETGNNDGTYVNGPTQDVTGALVDDTNKSVTFAEASTQYVTMGDVLDFERTDTFSLEGWVKTSTTGTSKRIISKQDHNSPFSGYSFSINTSEQIVLLFRNDANSSILVNSSATNITDGNWHHVAVTYDGSSSASGVKIYLDGVDLSLTIVNDNLTTTTLTAWPFNISGINNGGIDVFDGTIDEVAVYDIELTETQVQNHYTRGLNVIGYPATIIKDGPVGYWRLGEASGTDAFDVTRKYDGTYVNTPTLGEDGVIVDDVDTAATFTSASTQYVTMGDVLDFERTDTFSLECWFKSTQTGSGVSLIAKQRSSTQFNGYAIGFQGSNDRLYFIFRDGSGNHIFVETTSTFNDGNWHHVAVTYDGSVSASGVVITVDNVIQSLTTLGDNLTATTLTTYPLNFAARESGGNPLDGTVDEVAIYPTELSAAQIEDHYTAGLASKAITTYNLQNFNQCRVEDTTGNYQQIQDTVDYGIFDNEWHHVAITWDPTPQEFKLYVDGAWRINGEGVGAITDVSSAIPLKIGEEFNGSLDETMYFDRALTAVEVSELYEANASEYRVYGNVTQDAVPVERLVRLYRRDTGAFVQETTSVGGSFDIRWREFDAFNDEYFVVAFDDDIVPDLEPIARERLTPVVAEHFLTPPVYHGGHVDMSMNGPYGDAVINDSPVAFWRMDEASGILHDLGSSGTTMSPGGTPTYAQTGPLVGQGGASISFNGTTDYFQATATPLGTGNVSPYSVEFFVYRVGSGLQTILSQQDVAGSNFNIFDFMDASNLLTMDKFPPTSQWHLSIAPTVSTWYHVVMVEDPSHATQKRRIYINGTLNSSVGTVETFTGGTVTTIAIGRRAEGNWYLSGRLSEIALYTTALSDAQVATHWAATGL